MDGFKLIKGSCRQFIYFILFSLDLLLSKVIKIISCSFSRFTTHFTWIYLFTFIESKTNLAFPSILWACSWGWVGIWKTRVCLNIFVFFVNSLGLLGVCYKSNTLRFIFCWSFSIIILLDCVWLLCLSVRLAASHFFVYQLSN